MMAEKPSDKELRSLAEKAKQDRAAANEADVNAALSLSGETYEVRGIRLGQPNYLSFTLLQAMGNPLAQLFRSTGENTAEVNWAVLPTVLALIELSTRPDSPLRGLPNADKIKAINLRADEIAQMVPISEIPDFISEALPALLSLLKPLVDLAGGGGKSTGDKFRDDGDHRTADEDIEMATGANNDVATGGHTGIDDGRG